MQNAIDDIKRELDYEYNDLGASVVPRRIVSGWRFLSTQGIVDSQTLRMAHRLNGLANFYYFVIQILKKNRVQRNTDFRKNLHYQMCLAVMKDGLKEVIEIPRDHYKSTIYSESYPIWRALPFTPEDEHAMRTLLATYMTPGETELFVEWMHRTHNQDNRILLVSETIGNAIKLGTRLRGHYENNAMFRQVFDDILPDTSCRWKDESLQQKRTAKGLEHGEGTFDFLGVGGALQSRHYNIVIQDDLVGNDARKSEKVMKDTIEYHQLLVGAFDADTENAGRDNDEIVVGNRWSYNDLNSYIRDNESYYSFIRHSALGGCCTLHPWGTPIFPEAFNLHKLARWKQRLGIYLYSCQFENVPINPEKCKFDASRLRYFHYERNYSATTYNEDRIDNEKKRSYRVAIRHHVAAGDVEDDIYPRNLQRFMVIDPNHSGQKGRCRHAITITGVQQNPRRIYLLNAWADAIDINSFVEKIFEQAIAFKINTIHIETVAAQKYLKFHLEYYVQTNKAKRPEIAHIKFADLKSTTTANAKFERIDSIIPIVERGEFWVDANASNKFMEELKAYGNKNGLVDILDTLGYGPQIWKFDDVDDVELERLVMNQQTKYRRAMRATTFHSNVRM